MPQDKKEMSRGRKLLRLFLSTLYISSFTFGGGFVIVTFMKKKFVDELHWIDEQEMLDMTAIAQSSPGAIAVNAAILVGWRVAGFIGMPQMNFFDAKLTRQNGRYAVTVGGVTVELSDEKQQRLAEHNVAEQDVTLGVRPDHLMLCADGIKGTVDVSEMMGSSVHLHVAAEGKDVIVIVPTNGAAAHFPMGSEVNMIFGGNVAHVFDKETGKNLEW